MRLATKPTRSRRLGRGASAGRLLAFLVAFVACGGEHQGPGDPALVQVPAARVAARAERQAAVRATVPIESEHQILFGDLHVHTTFSPDAFMTSLPMAGGSGLHPPADACDFARLCADLDFWSINDHAEGISPRHWRETVESIQACNARAGDPADPDSVAFLGWEWSQVGSVPDRHYGHKNVIFLETDPDRVPSRPIAAPRPDFRVAAIPGPARWMLSLRYFGDRKLFADYQVYYEEVNAVPICEAGVDVRSLPDECHEVAPDPRTLHAKLDEWGARSLVIPHGTTWGLMTPRGFTLARELESGQHRPDRQRLFEIYSGHGSAEPFRDWPDAWPETGAGGAACLAPTAERLPCCWRAGEIIRERCQAAGEGERECEARAAEARRLYLEAGAAAHLTVPGAEVADWLDCDQCRDCFAPAFSPRPGGSAQTALALDASARQAPGAVPGSDRFRFGLIAASDTHDARPGNGFKEFDRLGNTEALHRSGWMARMLGDAGEPEARARPMRVDEVPLGQRRDVERGSSFLFTGGLTAVHAASRGRESIWEALEARRVYGTSGERILLWFDLLNSPAGMRSMGAEVVGQAEAPRFRAAAAGAFAQQPGCPDFVRDALTPERLESLCSNECYHPSDRRHPIDRLEVVRIRPGRARGPSLAERIEDPWQVLPCDDRGEGCAVEFEDPDFASEAGEVVYYVRAVQRATPAVNGAGLRCRKDEAGRCVEVEPCYGDARTSPDDDCLAEVEERAWSSPIFVAPAAPATPVSGGLASGSVEAASGRLR